MKNDLFKELRKLGKERVTIWERLEGDSNVSTVTSGAADKVLNELAEYYADYDEDAISCSVDLPVITVTVK